MARQLKSCKGCVFCVDFVWGQPPSTRYLCGLGLDVIFHTRNDTPEDTSIMGCKTLDPEPVTPCKGRYSADKMRKKLGIWWR